MVIGHKIREKVEINKFLEQIQEYTEKDIETTNHAFFHFSEEQRKVYDELFLKNILFNEIPIFVGIQHNRLWALFYRYKKEILKMIIDIQIDKIYIVTFYIIDETQIPRI